jgi:hypothetical protein
MSTLLIQKDKGLKNQRERSAFDAGQACGIGVDGLEVVEFKVRVVGEDVGLGGIAAEEFEQEFHRVAEIADAGFAVADFWRESDSLE